MDTNTILAVLFGAGGTGAVAAAISFIQALRKGKLESEEALITRLNNDSKQQNDRADKAMDALAKAREEFDTELTTMRKQRDKARETAAEFRLHLISAGFNNVPTLDDLYAA